MVNEPSSTLYHPHYPGRSTRLSFRVPLSASQQQRTMAIISRTFNMCLSPPKEPSCFVLAKPNHTGGSFMAPTLTPDHADGTSPSLTTLHQFLCVCLHRLFVSPAWTHNTAASDGLDKKKTQAEEDVYHPPCGELRHYPSHDVIHYIPGYSLQYVIHLSRGSSSTSVWTCCFTGLSQGATDEILLVNHYTP